MQPAQATTNPAESHQTGLNGLKLGGSCGGDSTLSTATFVEKATQLQARSHKLMVEEHLELQRMAELLATLVYEVTGIKPTGTIPIPGTAASPAVTLPGITHPAAASIADVASTLNLADALKQPAGVLSASILPARALPLLGSLPLVLADQQTALPPVVGHEQQSLQLHASSLLAALSQQFTGAQTAAGHAAQTGAQNLLTKLSWGH